MFIYVVAVVALVVLTSIALAFITKKNGLLNKQMIVAIGLSSIAVSLLFPLLFNAFLNSAFFFTGALGVFIALLTAFVIHIALVFLLSLVISALPPEKEAGKLIEYLKEPALYRWVNSVFSKGTGIVKKLSGNHAGGKPLCEKQEEQPAEQGGGQALAALQAENAAAGQQAKQVEALQQTEQVETIQQTEEVETLKQTERVGTPQQAEQVETPQQIELMKQPVQDMEQEIFSSEKPVDGDGNIVKAEAKEEFYQDGQSSIEEYLDKAFKMKEAGDLEGAIQQYMHVLEKNPAEDLGFWIIVDICALYKALGQSELARDILEGCISSYKGVMDSSVKAEIEKNLTYI